VVVFIRVTLPAGGAQGLISSRSDSCMHHEASIKLHPENIFESHQSDNPQEYDTVAYI